VAGAVLWNGTDPLSTALLAPPLDGFGPEQTTDAWLGFLAIPEPTRAVKACFDGLPRKENVLFVTPEGELGAASTFYLFSMLAWPREVRWLSCPPAGKPVSWIVPGDRPPLPWVLYCDLPLPAGRSPAFGIGPRIQAMKSSGERDWISYCPPLPSP
jgi:hypothetical protein